MGPKVAYLRCLENVIDASEVNVAELDIILEDFGCEDSSGVVRPEDKSRILYEIDRIDEALLRTTTTKEIKQHALQLK